MSSVVCPHCQHEHKITGELPVGRKASCKKCGQSFTVVDDSMLGEDFPAPPVAPVHLEVDDVSAFLASPRLAAAVNAARTNKNLNFKPFVPNSVLVFIIVPVMFAMLEFAKTHYVFYEDNAMGSTANSMITVKSQMSIILFSVSFLGASVLWVLDRNFRR